MERDVKRFGKWATSYDEHWLQPRFFEPVHHSTLRRAALLRPAPRRLLDIGCGTGALLRKAAGVFPSAALAGVDPATGMVQVARGRWAESRLADFVNACAEGLPFVEGAFDLVLSTMSFHHWADQQAGLREIRRVLAPGGVFLLTDAFAVSWLRLVFAIGRSRSRFHTRGEIEAMLRSAGLNAGGFEPAIDLKIPAVCTIWATRAE